MKPADGGIYRERIAHARFKGERVRSAKDLITIAPYFSHHLPPLPPSILFANLSIYIYHQLANCSNLPSTVKMKTSRVRVHRNSVYYRNSRIASWRANEQSIVPPFPDQNSRWSKNFAKQGQPEGGDVARKLIDTVQKKQVFDSGQEGKNKGKRDDGE